MSTPNTYFAPAERINNDLILFTNNILREKYFIRKTLEALPINVLVLNQHRQAVYCNHAFLHNLGVSTEEEILGKRPGEVLHCCHVDNAPSGCGTSQSCAYCGAVLAILDCIQGRESTKQCHIHFQINGESHYIDAEVKASPMVVDNESFICFSMSDIGNEKKRQALEHLFLHDVSNTVTLLHCMIDMLDLSNTEENAQETFRMLKAASLMLLEEINSHKQIIMAEEGSLLIKTTPIQSEELISEIIKLYSSFDMAQKRHIVLDMNSKNILFNSDPTILKRVISNMLKNALEESKQGDTITVSNTLNNDNSVVISVHNPQPIKEDYTNQIFNRIDSAKGKHRGFGTYSIKILTERYLNGKCWYESSPQEGTKFSISLPDIPHNG